MSAEYEAQIKSCRICDTSIVRDGNKYCSKPELLRYKNLIKKPLSDFEKLQYINILSHDFSLLRLLSYDFELVRIAYS